MKKCPVCSREYRDVVSLCPFDGAGLAPIVATPETITVAPLDDEPPATLELPAEDVREIIAAAEEEVPTEVVPPRVAQPTTLLTEPLPLRNRDEDETHYRPITIPLEEDESAPPPVNDYRPNAANAASLPYVNEYEENRRAYNPNVPPVVPPLGAARPPMPPTKEANPWRWATFGLAGLILVFAGAWFFLGGSRPGANTNDPMAVDPNAANVNAAPPLSGMEGFPPPDANFNASNFNSLPPLPPGGTTVNPNLGGSTGPFPSGPPPSLNNLNSVYPPPVINSNAPNSNAPNFNSGGIKSLPTPNPLASPKTGATPKPLATPGTSATPSGTVKPAATPIAGPSPKPTAKPAASPKPAGTPEGPEPLR